MQGNRALLRVLPPGVLAPAALDVLDHGVDSASVIVLLGLLQEELMLGADFTLPLGATIRTKFCCRSCSSP